MEYTFSINEVTHRYLYFTNPSVYSILKHTPILNRNWRVHLIEWIGSLGLNNHGSIKSKVKENEKTNIYLLWGTFTKNNASEKQVTILSSQASWWKRGHISRCLMLSAQECCIWDLKTEEFRIVSQTTEILADILGFGNIPNFQTFSWVYFLNSCFSVQVFLF